MENRFRCFVAFFFVMSLIVTPNAAVLAQSAGDAPLATPIVTVPEDGTSDIQGMDTKTGQPETDALTGTPSTDVEKSPETQVVEEIQPGTPATDGEESPLSQIQQQIPLGTPDSIATPDQGPEMGTLEIMPNTFIFTSWNFSGGNLTGVLKATAGFVAEPGDTLTLYYSSESLSLAPGPYSLAPELPAEVTANDATETLTITFTAPFTAVPSPGDIFLQLDVAFPGTITFPACGPLDTDYTNTATVRIVQPTESGLGSEWAFTVDGELCDATSGPEVTGITYEPTLGLLLIGVNVPEAGVTAGTQLTVTYPEHLLSIQSEPVEFVLGLFSLDPIGTAVASDGVITITFNELASELEALLPSTGIIFMQASFNTAAICAEIDGTQTEEIGRLYFHTSYGETFTVTYSTSANNGYENTILCGSAKASITGEVSDDGTEIHWTVDTGDLINGGTISIDSTGFADTAILDCSSVNVVPVLDSTNVVIDCTDVWVDVSTIEVTLDGNAVTRATITYTTPLVPIDSASILFSCSVAVATGNMVAPMTVGRENAGLGSFVCATVFPPGGGDFISNVASADTVYKGDELTYVMSFETTTNAWIYFYLNVFLPEQGFDVTNIECTFNPDELQQGECAVGDDNTISVAMNFESVIDDPGAPTANIMADTDVPMYGSITLEITGTVTAESGSILAVEACGERSIAIPGFPIELLLGDSGSGVICSTASTRVLPVTQDVSLVVSTEDNKSPEGVAFEISEVPASSGAIAPFVAITPINGVLPASGVIDIGELEVGNSYLVNLTGVPKGYQNEAATFEVAEGTGTWNMTLQSLPEDPTPTPTSTSTQSPTATNAPGGTMTPTATSTATATGTTEPGEKQTIIQVEAWDGRSLEGALWTLTSLVDGPGSATGVLDASNSAMLTDIPAGRYRFVVAPDGLPSQEFIITISNEFEVIVPQFLEPASPTSPVVPDETVVPTTTVTPDPSVSPTASSSPTVAPGAPDSDPESTSEVTGLPSTGRNGSSATSVLLVATIAAGILIVAGIGIQMRPRD